MLSKVNVPKTSLQLVAMCCLEVAGECPAGPPFLTRSFSRWFSGRLFGPKGSRALAAPPTMSIRDRADEAARVGRSTRDLPIALGALPRSIDIVGLAARLRAASPPPQFQKSHPLGEVLELFSLTNPPPSPSPPSVKYEEVEQDVPSLPKLRKCASNVYSCEIIKKMELAGASPVPAPAPPLWPLTKNLFKKTYHPARADHSPPTPTLSPTQCS